MNSEMCFKVGCEVKSTTTLLDYIRHTLELRGTKYMCLEGGCGACIVSTVKSQGDHPRGVNSCMVSITSCQNWDIKTIEKVGNRLDGYHPLQTSLAEANGTQCGYCSPGMVMNMYSLLQSKHLTMLEIEKSFGGNICRCTGYKPILDAFKKFASDAPTPVELLDIEDLKLCRKSGKACARDCEESDWCFISRTEVDNELVHIKLEDNRDWYRARTVSDVFYIWQTKGVDSYMLVAGNTAKGVYPILEYPKLLIDVSSISELKGSYYDQNLIIRAGTTLADVIDIFKEQAGNDGFSYLNVLLDHLELVASIPIRNLATLAGNLMIKNGHPEFKSDIFIILETVGAQITILKPPNRKIVLTAKDFLKEKMTGKLILNVIFPPLSPEHKVVSYKIMPRFQNAHALVHAGFVYKLNKTNTVLECRIVYGVPNFIHAVQTENYIKGKPLFVNETLQGALEVLNKEIVVLKDRLSPSVEYQRRASLGLFYKDITLLQSHFFDQKADLLQSLLSLCPKNILNSKYISGATKLRDTRQVSGGHEVFDTNPTLWPLNQPMPKVEGLFQCAGEAKYTDDAPKRPRELSVAFVLAKVPLGTIENIDASEALNEKGVAAFFSASDIIGINSFISAPNILNTTNEELFCNGDVKYYDQPIGIIVADCQSTANKAATLVKVKYTNERKPVIDIKIAKNDPSRISIYSTNKSTKRGNDVVKIIKGSNTIYQQYHFCMETLVSLVYPIQEGLRMLVTTQWLDEVHESTSRVLKLDQSRIDVYVRLLGGAFGLKLTRPNQIAASAALAAYKLNLPCRFITPLNINMRAIGKRLPCSRDFEVGVNASGVIQYVNYDLYSDNGYIYNEPLLLLGIDLFNNCYKKETWNFRAYKGITDTASNTWCRSPGTLENVVMAEYMIEQIAYKMDLDPLDVRLANLDTEKYGALQEMLETLKNNSQYAERKASLDVFNKNNRWKKRGLRFCFLRWTPFGYQNYDINMSVYAKDGTVVITHAGIEMGQGINTKAIQICAYLLKIPIDKIQIKGNDTVIAPNGYPSGGSISSQTVGIGVRKCCEELIKRLEPIKREMDNPTWLEVIQKAAASDIDLQFHSFTTSKDTVQYDIFGITLAEVDIDVLTGECQINRVDLIEDAGQSVNPDLDIGQVRGAFTMGLGYGTTENFVFDPDTGEVLTNRTWEYFVPQAMDIPQIFNIYLRKKSYSSEIILGAKGTGEPATCMGVVINFAMRQAIAAARLESGIPTTEWFDMDGPYTVDKICVSTATKLDEFIFN